MRLSTAKSWAGTALLPLQQHRVLRAGDTAWFWASCTAAKVLLLPQNCGASAPPAAFHCLGKVLSSTWESAPCSTADSGHFYNQGSFFPCFCITASSQGQEDSQTFPDNGVSTLAASAMGSVHCRFRSPTLHILSPGLRSIRYEKNFCTCLSKREFKVIIYIYFCSALSCVSLK